MAVHTQFIEVQACGPDDPNGEQAATVLAAYFRAERARAIRQDVWRWLLPIGAAAWLLAAFARIMSYVDLAIVVIAGGALGLWSALSEWRAERALWGAVRANTRGERTPSLSGAAPRSSAR